MSLDTDALGGGQTRAS